MIKLMVYDGTSDNFGRHNDKEGCYEKLFDMWPWDVPPARGLMMEMGGEAFAIRKIHLQADGTAVVELDTGDVEPPASWHAYMQAEGYTFEPV